MNLNGMRTMISVMLGHASLEQTSTYLNVQRGRLRESMRRIDEARSRCNPVVIGPTIDHQTDHNVEQQPSRKPMIN